MASRNLAWLVRVYPRPWRVRYEDEFRALLEEYPASPRAAANIIWGALDAHLLSLAAHLSLGGTLPMFRRPQASAITVFSAWAAFVVAGLCFYGVLDDNPLTVLARSHPAVRLAVLVVQAGAVLALLTVAAGTLPVAAALLRSAIGERRASILALLAVPLAGGLVVLAYGAVLLLASRFCMACAPTGLLARALVYGFQFVVLAAIVVSTAALALAVARGGVSQHIYVYTRLPAALTTLAMALTLAGVMAWGLLALAIAPSIFLTTEGIFALPTVLAWLGIVAGMALALGVAGAATARGYRVG